MLTSTFDANKEMERDSILVTLEPKVFEMSPLVVPSHLRVMVELEKFVEDGVLEGVDAVLGCPILFPKLDSRCICYSKSNFIVVYICLYFLSHFF